MLLLVGVTIFPQRSEGQWTWTWVRKIPSSGFNDSFWQNPWNPNILYASPGNNVIWISRDRGHNWSSYVTVPGGSQIKSVKVSARDTAYLLVAQEAGPPDRIMRSTNAGATWTQTLAGNFYYWGNPLAYEPSLNDETVYTYASNILYRSTNFGATWDTVRVNPFNTSNQGWEDALIRPDSSNILLVADNANGILKSTDRGLTWRRTYAASGEVPAMALDPINPRVAYAAKWGGGGGFVKTTDGGETWQAIALFNGVNMWGVAVSTTHPNYVVTGTWGHSFSSNGGTYLSRDAGATWERTYEGMVSTSNHALMILDTLSIFGLQGDGIWKLRFPGRIRGMVYHDINGNGTRDPGEPGMQSWKVRLGGARVDSTMTDATGAYEFYWLNPGTYGASVAVSGSWVVTEPNGNNYGVSVTDGDQHLNKDFGVRQANSVGEGDGRIPVRFALHQNYPNPFNPTTTIGFDLPQAARVSLTVFNIYGQRVAEVLSGKELHAGTHSVSFDAGKLSSGVYFYRLETSAGYSAGRKMLVLK
jgi:photosystem II stability/assembly factor-like uncharacterized protein